MTRDEALRQADEIVETILRSGDPTIFEEARGPDGRIDQAKLIAAAIRARREIADRIMTGEIWSMTPP